MMPRGTSCSFTGRMVTSRSRSLSVQPDFILLEEYTRCFLESTPDFSDHPFCNNVQGFVCFYREGLSMLSANPTTVRSSSIGSFKIPSYIKLQSNGPSTDPYGIPACITLLSFITYTMYIRVFFLLAPPLYIAMRLNYMRCSRLRICKHTNWTAEFLSYTTFTIIALALILVALQFSLLSFSHSGSGSIYLSSNILLRTLQSMVSSIPYARSLYIVTRLS